MSILIKQAPPKTFKLGLEKQGLNKFENSNTTFGLTTRNGKFSHGLKDDEEIELVEKYYGWSFDNEKNHADWSSLEFKLEGTVNAVDIKKDPSQLLMVRVAEQLGLIATSLEQAEDPMSEYEFVMYNESEEEELKATYYEKLDSAIIELGRIRKTPKYLIGVAKFLLPSSTGIGKDSTKAYAKLREYINGDVTKRKNEAVDRFLKSLTIEKATLYVTVDFKEAFAKNIIRKNTKQRYYNPKSKTEYGKTESEAIAFLSDLKNQDELGLGNKNDAEFSIRAQLASYL